MRLVILWVHVVAAVVWVGGVAYQLHVLMPAARRGGAAAFAEAARRARPITWTAIGLVVLSGFYNVTQLGAARARDAQRRRRCCWPPSSRW